MEHLRCGVARKLEKEGSNFQSFSNFWTDLETNFVTIRELFLQTLNDANSTEAQILRHEKIELAAQLHCAVAQKRKLQEELKAEKLNVENWLTDADEKISELQEELNAENLKAQNQRTDTDQEMFEQQNTLEAAHDSLLDLGLEEEALEYEIDELKADCDDRLQKLRDKLTINFANQSSGIRNSHLAEMTAKNTEIDELKAGCDTRLRGLREELRTNFENQSNGVRRSHRAEMRAETISWTSSNSSSSAMLSE